METETIKSKAAELTTLMQIQGRIREIDIEIDKLYEEQKELLEKAGKLIK